MRERRRGSDLQEMWSANVAPWMMGARLGAGHAMEIVARERMRARTRSGWLRQRRRRMLMMTGTGIALLGIAGAIAAMQYRRQSTEQYPQGEFEPAGAERDTAGFRPPAYGQPQAQQAQARQAQAPTSSTAAGQRARPQ